MIFAGSIAPETDDYQFTVRHSEYLTGMPDLNVIFQFAGGRLVGQNSAKRISLPFHGGLFPGLVGWIAPVIKVPGD